MIKLPLILRIGEAEQLRVFPQRSTCVHFSVDTFWTHWLFWEVVSGVKLLDLNAPGAIRTHGPRIRNPVLYPPELRGHK
jgi:hypothetical protein